MTAGDIEIDLVVDRPGQPTLLIEIKNKHNVSETDLKNLTAIASDLDNCEAICLSQDPMKKKIGNVTVYPWQEGILTYFK